MNSDPHLVQQSIFFPTPFQSHPCILPLPRAVPTYPECPHDLTSVSPILVCPDLSRSVGVSMQLLLAPLESTFCAFPTSQLLIGWERASPFVSGILRSAGTAVVLQFLVCAEQQREAAAGFCSVHLALTLQPFFLGDSPVSPAQSACYPPCPQMRSTQHSNGSSKDCF